MPRAKKTTPTKKSATPRRAKSPAKPKALLRKDGMPTKATREGFVQSDKQAPRFAGHVPLTPVGKRPEKGDPSYCQIDDRGANTNREVAIDIGQILGELQDAAKDAHDVTVDLKARFTKSGCISRYGLGQIKSAMRGVNVIHDRLRLLMETHGDTESVIGDADFSETAGEANTRKIANAQP